MGLIVVERILLYIILIGIGLILLGGLMDILGMIQFGVIAVSAGIAFIIFDNVELKIK